ncbi:hypothetical protein SE17_33895, partial [Kouleothrix aurantiaca]
PRSARLGAACSGWPPAAPCGARSGFRRCARRGTFCWRWAACWALPAAIGLGPFGAERSLGAAGAEAGLDAPTTALVRFARLARGAALLAALSVAVLPAFDGSSVPPALAGRATSAIMPWAGLAIIAGLFVVFALVLRQISVLTPRMTLPGALRWCWRWALPLALAGAVYLAVVTR